MPVFMVVEGDHMYTVPLFYGAQKLNEANRLVA